MFQSSLWHITGSSQLDNPDIYCIQSETDLGMDIIFTISKAVSKTQQFQTPLFVVQQSTVPCSLSGFVYVHNSVISYDSAFTHFNHSNGF